MTINELLINIKNPEFNMEREMQVKTYLQIEEKKLIAQGIIYECTVVEDGSIKVDSVQQYLSYVKYMITKHTNLVYTEDDYDKLMTTKCGETTLMNAIIGLFDDDAKECARIMRLMTDDYVKNNAVEHSVAKFLETLSGLLGIAVEKFGDKLGEFDFDALIPKGEDVDKLNGFLNKYVK